MVKRFQYIIIISLLLMSWTVNLFAQSSSAYVEGEDLYFYADVMVNADQSAHRVYAAERFEELFLEALGEKESFKQEFDSLKWVSKIAPESGAFRLFSWQLMKGPDTYKYFALLQKPDGSVVRFQDNRPFLNGAELSQFTNNQWYGALYYGIYPFEFAKQKAWILLGFDSNNRATNRKIADVMLLEEDGVQLGAPVFEKKISGGAEIKHRIIIEYADASAGRIQFDREEKMIIYDHLITLFSEGPGKGAVPVPDGSYEAYQLKGKKWVYVEKVFNQVLDEAPRDRPVLEGKQEKDIFGRKKN